MTHHIASHIITTSHQPQERVRRDLTEWLLFLRDTGFDGWRLDFVRGYAGQFVKQYVDATVPALGEGPAGLFFWGGESFLQPEMC